MRTSNIVQTSQSSREVGENAIAMSIDEASSVFLMDALGKLYSRPAQAALREYLSNAIDAHKAKGGKLPAVQITLPDKGKNSAGSSKLFIRDFGNGMNEGEFSTILSRYGASTKRDSNAMIGGFGLGAKSGFAVSNEFFMTSYQQGKGIRVRIFKDALNKGFIDVIDRFTTKEADGILVELPIPDGNLYELTKKSLFTDFPFFMGYGVDAIDIVPASADFAGQSVHNASTFTALDFGGTKLGWLAKKSYAGASATYALIGKVAYPIDLSKFFALSKQNKTVDKELVAAVNMLKSFRRVKVIDLPIGSVDLPSSREEITYSERSIRTIGAILSNYALVMRQHIQKELNTKKTKLQVLAFLADLETSGYKDMADLTWKGEPVGVGLFKTSEIVFSTLGFSSYQGSSSVNHSAAKSLKNVAELSTRSAKASYKKGIYRITVDSASDIAAVKKLMTLTIIREFLKIDETAASRTYGYRNETSDALFVIAPKDDALNDWLFGHTNLDVAELHKIVQKLKDAEKDKSKKAEEERVRREAAKAKAQKAKETRAQSMLSNFIVNDSDGRSVTRNTVETVFKNANEVRYYWSEEEVNEFANVTKGLRTIGSSENKTGLLFPFWATPVANTFNAAKEGRAYSEINYMTKLRAFLRLFFATGTKMIIVGKAWDLNEFKATYPEVKSGVLAVKEAVESQLADEHSAIMISYNAIGDSRFKDKSEVKNLLRFAKALNASQKAGLNEEITSAVERFNVVMVSSAINKLDEKYFMEALKGFASIASIEAKSYSVGSDTLALTAKYPLLMNGDFNQYSSEVVAHLLDYINMCDKK